MNIYNFDMGNRNFECIETEIFNETQAKLMEWKNINYLYLYELSKSSLFSYLHACKVSNKVYVCLGCENFILDIKGYEKFLKLSSRKENIIDWKKDGF